MDSALPLKMVNDPSSRSSDVAELPLPAATDRLIMFTLSDVIGSLRAPGLSSAYRSVRGPSAVVSAL